MLLADFVRRADRRGTSERTSGGKAVTGATGSICHHRVSVKSIFYLFSGQQPRFSRFPPVFRLFARTGETTKLPFSQNLRTHFRLHSHSLRNRKSLPLAEMKLKHYSSSASSPYTVDCQNLYVASAILSALRVSALAFLLAPPVTVTAALRPSTLLC